jgi:pilus assembly protein Flp/PilA
MKKLVKRFFMEADGVTAIEYALIAGLIAVIIVGVVMSVGNSANAMFVTVDSAVNVAAGN